jgi:hypothetical protein
MTAIVGGFATGTLYLLRLPGPALACAAGSVVMIVNFFLLAAVAGGIVAIARERGGVSRAGILLAPLKLLFLIVAVYAIVSVFHLNVPGFAAGILTQFAAIFIETWRTSPRLMAGGGARTEGNHF